VAATGVLDHREDIQAAPLSVTVSMKSAASSASVGERTKPAQVVADRSGAGSVPASRRISHTCSRTWMPWMPGVGEREQVSQRQQWGSQRCTTSRLGPPRHVTMHLRCLDAVLQAVQDLRGS
jgi:hypothetical protein